MTQPTRADSPTKTCTAAACSRPVRARGYCSTHYNKLCIGSEQRHPKCIVPCVVCGVKVTRRVDNVRTRQPTCSVACRRLVQWGERQAPVDSYDWAADAVRRAAKHGAPIVEEFTREEIFERDGWACRLCGVACTAPNPHDLRAATVDHVVPLALGGVHSRDNAQTACLSCNSAKGLRPSAT